MVVGCRGDAGRRHYGRDVAMTFYSIEPAPDGGWFLYLWVTTNYRMSLGRLRTLAKARTEICRNWKLLAIR